MIERIDTKKEETFIANMVASMEGSKTGEKKTTPRGQHP